MVLKGMEGTGGWEGSWREAEEREKGKEKNKGGEKDKKNWDKWGLGE